MNTFKREIIKKIVKAINIESGELVLLQFWGDDKDIATLHNFSYEIVALGATPIEIQQSREVNSEIFNIATDTCYNEKYYSIFDNVDTIIDICMYKAVKPSPKLMENKEQFDLYRKHMATLFSTLTKKKKFVQIRIPTEQFAIEEYIDTDIFITNMNKAYDIDYDALKIRCQQKVDEIKDKKSVSIKTKNNCMLTLWLEDRNWFIDAGDGDLPCGEVGIAPVESKTNGTVYFDKLFLDVNLIASDVILTIKDGKIISSNSDIFNEFLQELPHNGDIICELGLGMNENINELIGYAVLDEKMANTFHLGIGMNTLFGGKNDCMMHMDFVGVGELIFN